MTCKQFIQFVFGRKPWNSIIHVFTQDKKLIFFYYLAQFEDVLDLSFVREMTDLKIFWINCFSRPNPMTSNWIFYKLWEKFCFKYNF